MGRTPGTPAALARGASGGYTGQTLAMLSGRPRAYGYRHTERFLAELAVIGANAALTEALARWTALLWKPRLQERVGLASTSVAGHPTSTHPGEDDTSEGDPP
ncbi:hypothetical protein [Ktedonospora formicarum]|uniref:hypothetical protein n=1 Tax=Ktedonospora formicarum TaxID=2778364 RepID=UPI001C68B9CB|nr:hypothetical protein [Ktedonospora formicarum]